jgi:hypothetical protein
MDIIIASARRRASVLEAPVKQRRRCACIPVIVCLIAIAVLLGLTAASASASSTIELVGESSSRTIPLEVAASPAAGSLRGSLLLTLRNTSSTPQRVVILLAGDRLPGLRLLQRTVLPAQALKQVAVPVRLPPGSEPDVLEGSLIVEAARSRQSRPVEQFTLRVSGTLRPIGDVRFAPSTAIVQVTRWCIVLPCNTTDGGEVQLYGIGVGQLMEQLAAAGKKAVGTVLHAGSKTLPVELSELRAVPQRPGTATAHLKLLSKPSAGNYTGSLALAPLLTQSPSLPIEVHSRYWVVWTVLIILLGVVLAGILYQQLGLWRRKQLLRRLLQEAVDSEYCPRHGENQVAEAPEGRLIRPLEIKCPLHEDPNWNYNTELDTSRSIYTAIRWARNDTDIDEAQTAAVTLVHGIKSWLLMLTEVQTLWTLSHEAREKQGEWDQMRTASDSRLLLLRARHARLDGVGDASQLLVSVPQQAGWHRAVAEAWDLRARLIEAGGDTRQQAEQVVLSPVANPGKSIVMRDEDEQQQLELELEDLYGRLLTLRATPNALDVHLAMIAHAESELQAESLRNDLSSLESGASLAPAKLAASRALLTLSAAPAADVEPAAAAVPAPAAPAPEPATPETVGSNPKQLLFRLKLLDLAVSAVILLIVSLIYTTTVYGETWGSTSDWATAFGAGFGGQVTGKWALLPIYRSLRLRSTKAAESESGS